MSDDPELDALRVMHLAQAEDACWAQALDELAGTTAAPGAIEARARELFEERTGREWSWVEA